MRVFARNAQESRNDLAGPVRIEAPELLGQEVLLPAVVRLMPDHPALRVELRSSVLPMRLAVEEADLILRLVRPARATTGCGSWVSSGLACMPRPTMSDGAEPRCGLYRHRVIGWTEDQRFLTMESWLERLCPGLRPSLRLMSFAAQMEAVRNHAGWAVLPAFAAVSAGFLPALMDVPQLAQDLWLLCHEQAQSLPRDYLIAALRGKLHETAAEG